MPHSRFASRIRLAFHAIFLALGLFALAGLVAARGQSWAAIAMVAFHLCLVVGSGLALQQKLRPRPPQSPAERWALVLLSAGGALGVGSTLVLHCISPSPTLGGAVQGAVTVVLADLAFLFLRVLATLEKEGTHAQPSSSAAGVPT